MSAPAKSWIEEEIETHARSLQLLRRTVIVLTPLILVYCYYAYFLGPMPWLGFSRSCPNHKGISYTYVGTTYVGLWQGLIPVWKHHLSDGYWIDPQVLKSGELVIGNCDFDGKPEAGGIPNGELLALNPRGGVVWEFKPHSRFGSAKPACMTTQQEAILAEEWRDGVVGITVSGKPAWFRPELHLQPYSAIATATGSRFFIGTEDYPGQRTTLIAVNSRAKELWRTTVRGENINALQTCTTGDVVFATSLDNNKCGIPYAGWLYCIDSGGKLRWKYSAIPYDGSWFDLKVVNDHIEYLTAGSGQPKVQLLNFDGHVTGEREFSRTSWLR
jgi:hypothetical protein